MNPSKTLDDILKLIDKDVKNIKKANKANQLPPEDALTLSRYASTLSNISEVQEKNKEKQKKELDKLTTEELIDLYNKEKAVKKPAPQPTQPQEITDEIQ